MGALGRRALLPVLLSALPGACGAPATREIRATVVDVQGLPLPGAVFYAEALDEGGAFAFLFAVAGEAGEVPDSAREPLRLPWRPGARLAMAAFYPGRRPAVLRGLEGKIPSDAAVLSLERARGAAAAEPALLRLAFPFEEAPQLAAQLRGPEHKLLREVFRQAYEALAAGAAPEDSVLVVRKRRALEALEEKRPRSSRRSAQS